MSNQYLINGPITDAWIKSQLFRFHRYHHAGAHAFFLGQVRADPYKGTHVSGIEYSAYPEMIKPVIHEIESELFNHFNEIQTIEIRHSTGLVKVVEVSLFVLISSGHRKPVFAALENCVELIKQKLPVWKKELYEDGSFSWVQPPH